MYHSSNLLIDEHLKKVFNLDKQGGEYYNEKILTKKGFTLIELIVVIAILAILAAILIPSLITYITEAEEARDNANARSHYSELVLIASTGGTLPASPLPSGCTYTGTTAATIAVDCNGQTAP